MIKIKIERLDKPEVMTYTSTGPPRHTPVLEQYEPWDNESIADFKSVYLEFDEDWNIFSSPLMAEVDWYSRTFFASAKKLNISVEIDK